MKFIAWMSATLFLSIWSMLGDPITAGALTLIAAGIAWGVMRIYGFSSK